MLAGWLRAMLWRTDDWRGALVGALEDVRDAARTLDLGHALAYCDPDRTRAIRAYTAAWEGGATAAFGPLWRLAREVRDPVTLGRLAVDRRAGAPARSRLLEAAAAWIDAGEPARALGLLAAAQAAGVPEAIAWRIASLRAAIEGGNADVMHEVATWFERALTGGGAADAAHAIRLARVGGAPEEFRARLMRGALDRFPTDDDIGTLVESHLLGRADPAELLMFYRRRLAEARPDAEWVDEARAVGTRLCVREVAPGLGLRMVQRSLEHAYAAHQVDVPGHLASWTLLAEHARRIHATAELMPLVVTALGRVFPDDDRLWLARLGLEVSWRDQRDVEAAAAYAAIVIELAPDHHDVRDFVDAQDVPIDFDADDEVEELDALAMSLVYLDQHGGEARGAEVLDAGRAIGLAAARPVSASMSVVPTPVAAAVSEPVAASVSEPVAAAVREPVAAAVLDPVTVAAVIEPVAPAVREPVAAAVSEPIAAAVIDPVAPAVSELVAAVLDPVAAAVLDPVAAAVLDPVAAAVLEPVAAAVLAPVAPVLASIAAPVLEPAGAVLEPAAAPMIAPVMAPVFAPIAAVLAPVAAPMIAPVMAPGLAPIAPVLAPVAALVLPALAPAPVRAATGPVAPLRLGASLIPSAALTALRRVSARVRPPTRPGSLGGPIDRAARVVVPIDVTIELDDGALVKAVVRDVSTTGMFVIVDAEIALAAEVTVTIGVPARGDALAASTHRAWSRVARRGDGGYGLELLDPEPALVEALATLTSDA
jgi:hypothetical protein